MTSCRDVDRLSTAYVDGELDERRSSAVRGHLRLCTRCAERVEDEARVRELAADLGPIDPPSAMWGAIDARLAEAEIGDSHRSALSLTLQRGLDGLRRNALVVGGATAAAAILLLLLLPGPGDGGGHDISPTATARADVAGQPAPDQGERRPAGQVCAGARTHEELLLCQTHGADRRYVDAIADLTRAVSEERGSWSASDASRFDAALAELDHAAQIERLRLAGQPASAAPTNRDELHSIYRAQLELLSSAVLAGDFSGAAPWGEGP